MASPTRWHYLDPDTGVISANVPDLLPDTTTLLGQRDKFQPSWWQSRVACAGWTQWLDSLPESSVGQGFRVICRADLLRGWDGTQDGAGRLLVAGYVWGTGPWKWRVGRRAQTFTKNTPEQIGKGLVDAFGVLALDGPVAAYTTLLRGGIHNIRYLGPSFFTKALYAADAADGLPGRALILDQFVAVALNGVYGWGISQYGPWSSATYAAWLDFAHEKAGAWGTYGAPVRADAVEYTLFQIGRELDRYRRLNRRRLRVE